MPETWLSIEQAAVALGLSVRTVNRHIAANKLESRLTDGRREVKVALRQSALSNAQKWVTATDTEPAPFADGCPLTPPSAGEAASDFGEPAPSAVEGRSRAAVSSAAPVPEPTVASRPGTFGPTPHYPGAPSVTNPHPSDAAPAPSAAQPTVSTYDSQMVLALADSAAQKAELAVGAYQVLARTAVTQVEATRRGARIAWSLVGVMAVGVVAAVGWTTHRLTRVEVESRHLHDRVNEATALADNVSADREALRQELAEAREQAARVEGQLTALSDAQRREALRAAARASAAPTTRPTIGDRLLSLFE